MVFQGWDTQARSTTTWCFFHRFLTKNDQKRYEKWGDATRQANIALKPRFLEHFSRKISIFWSILGPKGHRIGLQNRSQNEKIVFWFHLVGPGCSRGQFWVDFGSILEVFWGLWGAFWVDFGATEVAKGAICNTSQKTAANRSKRHKKAANSAKKHQIIENRCKRSQILKA